MCAALRDSEERTGGGIGRLKEGKGRGRRGMLECDSEGPARIYPPPPPLRPVSRLACPAVPSDLQHTCAAPYKVLVLSLLPPPLGIRMGMRYAPFSRPPKLAVPPDPSPSAASPRPPSSFRSRALVQALTLALIAAAAALPYANSLAGKFAYDDKVRGRSSTGADGRTHARFRARRALLSAASRWPPPTRAPRPPRRAASAPRRH